MTPDKRERDAIALPIGTVVWGRVSGVRGVVEDVEPGRDGRRQVLFDDGRLVWVRRSRLSLMSIGAPTDAR